jgi:hypothetical protein
LNLDRQDQLKYLINDVVRDDGDNVLVEVVEVMDDNV